MPLFPKELMDPFSLDIHVPDPGLGNGGLGSRPAQGALAQEPQEPRSASQKGEVGAGLLSDGRKGLVASQRGCAHWQGTAVACMCPLQGAVLLPVPLELQGC